MARVLYRQGTKATYLGLLERNPNALYFCTDTKELFKGNDLYSDGIRVIDSYTMLPPYSVAADGILYFCNDNGCGYVLNTTKDGWIPVIHGVDNDTIGISENGLLQVKVIPIESVSGLSDKLSIIDAHILNIANEFSSLDERIQSVEQVVVGGVRYRGAVDTFEQLPTDANVGDLYEVYEDNSEWCWNGQKWFEYGKTVDVPTIPSIIEQINPVFKSVNYEITNKPIGTLVDYSDDEIRILMPSDMKYDHQDVGPTGDANQYYIGFKAYAPSNDVISFKEDMDKTITDNTMHYFENNSFAGIDSYGRKYSIVWLAVASYNDATGTWTYYGEKSTAQKYIGWDYTVEWFNSDGIKIAVDTIRINLANENCYLSAAPSYVTSLQSQIAELEESYAWGDM